MNQGDFAAYLEDRYYDQIRWYDEQAAWNKRMYQRLQWGLIVFAAVTPVLIEVGLDLVETKVFGRAATITALVVAVLSSALKAFKYQENWINYRTTCETLRKEKHFYTAGIGAYSKVDDREAVFVDQVEAMISRENTLWLREVKTEVEPEEP